MSITAVYVFTTTAFHLDVSSKIEQLVKDAPDRYSVVSRWFEAGRSFPLEPGVYRITSAATITAAPGFKAVEISATGTMPRATGHIIASPGTKTSWPPPPATTASATLNIPLATMQPFLTDAGAETMLDDAPAANG